MGGMCPVPTNVSDLNQDMKDAERLRQLEKEKLTLDPVKIQWREMYWRWTDVDQIDDLFYRLSELLKEFEFLRGHVVEATEKMKDLAKVYIIKDGGTLVDAVQAFFLAFAASCDGGSALSEVLKLRIEDKEPYIYLSCDGMNADIKSFNKCFKKYLKAVFEAPQKTIKMMEKFEEMSKAAIELVANLRELEQQFVNLPAGYWRIRGVKYTKENVEIAKDAGEKIKIMLPKLKEALKDTQQIAQNMETLFDMEWINQKAQEARALGKNKPSEMLELFNPKEKWQTEEVQKLQEQKRQFQDQKRKLKEEEKKKDEEKQKERKK